MTNIRDRYRQILSSYGIDGQQYKSSRVKERLLQHYGNRITFYRPELRTKSELVFASDSTAGRAVETATDITADAYLKIDAPVMNIGDRSAVLIRAALILNAEIRNTSGMKHFPPVPDEVNLDEMERQVGPDLSLFLQWLVTGVSNQSDLTKPPLSKDAIQYRNTKQLPNYKHDGHWPQNWRTLQHTSCIACPNWS